MAAALNASNAEGTHAAPEGVQPPSGAESSDGSERCSRNRNKSRKRAEKAALLGEPVEEQWARAAWHQVFKGERGSKGRRGAAPGPT